MRIFDDKTRNPMTLLPYAKTRGPNEPTEFDVVAARGSKAEVAAWVRQWYRTKYVPEDMLKELGLVIEE